MLKQLFLLVFSTILCYTSWTQTTSSSPYSTSGIGEEGALPEAQFGGIGNISSVVFDSTLINTYNPASYSLLSFGQPLFSVGVSSKFSDYSITWEVSREKQPVFQRLPWRFRSGSVLESGWV